MAADNLDSLYRRRLIRDVMYKHDASWEPPYDLRSEARGARPVSPLDEHVVPLENQHYFIKQSAAESTERRSKAHESFEATER